MRLIGAGWGRTGTTSLAAALDHLGFGPCMHMQEMWPHPELAEVWNRHRGRRRMAGSRSAGRWASPYPMSPFRI